MFHILFSVLTALPCFSSVLVSEGAQSIAYARETDSGYLALGALSDDWGGEPHLVVYKIDRYGMVVSQTILSQSGEIYGANEFGDGIAIVSRNFQSELSSVTCVNDAGLEQWNFLLSCEFLENLQIRSSATDLIVAGNVSDSPHIARLDGEGIVIWETTFPAFSFDVRDVCLYDGQIFLLGMSEEPGWQSSVSLLMLDFTGESPELHVLVSGDGRFSPEAIEVDSRGIFILLNAMTSENNMIYETRLMKFSSSLEIQWTASLCGSSWQRGSDLICMNSGDFAVCGWTNSLPFSETDRSDMILSKFNGNGELEWERTHGTVSCDYGFSVSSSSDGGFLVSGCITEDLYQGWLLKTDSLGSINPQNVYEQGNSEFLVVPLKNPVVDGILSFVVNSADSGFLEVSVFDTVERTVLSFTSSITIGENLLNISAALPSGVYSVRVSIGNSESVFRTLVCGGAE